MDACISHCLLPVEPSTASALLVQAVVKVRAGRLPTDQFPMESPSLGYTLVDAGTLVTRPPEWVAKVLRARPHPVAAQRAAGAPEGACLLVKS